MPCSPRPPRIKTSSTHQDLIQILSQPAECPPPHTKQRLRQGRASTSRSLVLRGHPPQHQNGVALCTTEPDTSTSSSACAFSLRAAFPEVTMAVRLVAIDFRRRASRKMARWKEHQQQKRRTRRAISGQGPCAGAGGRGRQNANVSDSMVSADPPPPQTMLPSNCVTLVMLPTTNNAEPHPVKRAAATSRTHRFYPRVDPCLPKRTSTFALYRVTICKPLETRTPMIASKSQHVCAICKC